MRETAHATNNHGRRGRTVLITGAAGFIGSHLAETCIEAGHEVVAVDAFTPYYSSTIKQENASRLREHPNCRFLDGDLRDLDLAELLEPVDTVFHLAAQAGVRSSWGQTFQEYVDHNVTALQALLEAAKAASLHRFVFASSSSVYGDAERLPTPEDTVLTPVSPYGATKALGEHLCHVYFKSYGVPIVMLRYFSVYGPRQRPDMAFHRLINAAVGEDEFTLFGDGEQTRDFTFVHDAVAGTVAAGEHGKPGAVYNLGGGSQVSMNDVVETIGRLIGTEPRIQRVDRQRGDARDTSADTSRAQTDLGYAPSRDLQAGLAEQVAWQEANVGLLAAAGQQASAG